MYTEEELLEAIDILVEDYGFDEEDAIDIIAESYEMELYSEAGESHTAEEWEQIRQREADANRQKEKKALMIAAASLSTAALYNHAMNSKKLTKRQKRALKDELKRKQRKAKIMQKHKLR